MSMTMHHPVARQMALVSTLRSASRAETHPGLKAKFSRDAKEAEDRLEAMRRKLGANQWNDGDALPMRGRVEG